MQIHNKLEPEPNLFDTLISYLLKAAAGSFLIGMIAILAIIFLGMGAR